MVTFYQKEDIKFISPKIEQLHRFLAFFIRTLFDSSFSVYKSRFPNQIDRNFDRCEPEMKLFSL